MEAPFDRAPPGAVPPLSYQIRVVDAIVVAVTASSSTYSVREVWKGQSATVLALDMRMHELLGYTPVEGGEVVLFLLGDKPLEVLPVVDGSVLYAPHDGSVQEKLTVEQLKERIVG